MTNARPAKRPYQICTNCIMDTSDSNITFDERGWCDYCNNYYENIIQTGTQTNTGRSCSSGRSTTSSGTAKGATMIA